MKTIYKGVKELIDPETNETIQMDVINKSADILDRKGWRRVIMADLMAAMEEIGNKKLKVLEFLIDNMNGSNQINTTYQIIEEKTGISSATIAATMKALQKSNLIKKIGGLYVLNCSIIGSYGSNDKNKYLMIEYGFNESTSIVKTSKTNEIKVLKAQNKLKDMKLIELENQLKELQEQLNNNNYKAS